MKGQMFMVKSKFRQLLAALLSSIILVSTLPIQTLSAEWGKGDEVYAAMLDNYIGSDGLTYGDKQSYK